MKILGQDFEVFEKLFDRYFQLPQNKRTTLNYWVIIGSLIFLAYKNDERHRTNYNTLSTRFDSINSFRSKEQKEYIKVLEFYNKKSNDLLEKILIQKEEIKQIKEKV